MTGRLISTQFSALALFFTLGGDVSAATLDVSDVSDVSGVLTSISEDGRAVLQLDSGKVDRKGDQKVDRKGGQRGGHSVRLSRGELAYLEAGDRIRAKMIKQPGGYLLETVWPDDPKVTAQMVAINSRLRRDTEVRGRQVFRSIGEDLPPFALYNQHGDLIRSIDLRGKICVVNFIFTRCMNPRMCPAATTRMQELQEKAKAAGHEDVLFLSMTLDPEFDTPGIFNSYAADREIDGSNYYFLSGPKPVLFDLKEQLGILASKDPKLIIDHTMRTIIADPSGKIVYQVPGSMWGMDDFLQRIEKLKAEDDSK